MIAALGLNLFAVRDSRRTMRRDRRCGAPGGTRTPGLQVRSLSLYPAELRARFIVRAPTVEIVPQHPLFTSFPMRWTLGWFCPDSGTNRDHVGRCRCARHVSAGTRKQEVARRRRVHADVSPPLPSER